MGAVVSVDILLYQDLFSIHTNLGCYIPPLNGFLSPQKLPLFTNSFTLDVKKSPLIKPIAVQIVMVIGRYEVWGCLLHLIEG